MNDFEVHRCRALCRTALSVPTTLRTREKLSCFAFPVHLDPWPFASPMSDRPSVELARTRARPMGVQRQRLRRGAPLRKPVVRGVLKGDPGLFATLYYWPFESTCQPVCFIDSKLHPTMADRKVAWVSPSAASSASGPAQAIFIKSSRERTCCYGSRFGFCGEEASALGSAQGHWAGSWCTCLRAASTEKLLVRTRCG